MTSRVCVIHCKSCWKRKDSKSTWPPEDRRRWSASSGGKYDLVVTDLKMPGMDGIRMIEKLSEPRRHPDHHHDRLCHEEPGHRRGKTWALHFFIEKPFRKQEFMDFVKRAIRHDEPPKETSPQKFDDSKVPALEMMTGISREIIAVRELIRKVAATDSHCAHHRRERHGQGNRGARPA